MNQFGSQQRKFAYLGGILLLLIPIIYLGMPADRSGENAGFIATQRAKYDLGETDLGELDPSGAAMNLVLLGLRGVAANILWVQAEEQKNHKDWAQMRATTESIIRLQPHFTKVWEYNGWNLAYNVSVEWDAVSDRYFWVKEGGKFLQKGVARNRMSPDLHWHVGRIYGPKIGLSDEARFFRRYFRADPDPRFDGGIDPDWNDGNQDNYLVAKDWFALANGVEGPGHRQTIMDRSIFRSYPARSQLDFASALQKYGFNEELDRMTVNSKPTSEELATIQDQVRDKLREQTREAWATGLTDWTVNYGQNELFTVPYEDDVIEFRMEMAEEDIVAAAKTPERIARYKRAIESYRKMINYRYWRTRALCEAEPETAEAHWMLFAAVEAYRKQALEQAREHASRSMTLFANLFEKYPELTVEEDLIEEAMTAILTWQYAYKIAGDPQPAEYPLKPLYDAKQAELPDYEKKFNRRFLTQQ
jgi:hypothetical protein